MSGDGPTQGDAIAGTGDHNILPTLLHDADLRTDAHTQPHESLDQSPVAIDTYHPAGLTGGAFTE